MLKQGHVLHIRFDEYKKNALFSINFYKFPPSQYSAKRVK